jgi:hypothetical protein
LEVEYLEVKHKKDRAWVVGVSAVVYFFIFLCTLYYVLKDRRRQLALERQHTPSYELLPLEGVEEEI